MKTLLSIVFMAFLVNTSFVAGRQRCEYSDGSVLIVTGACPVSVGG